MDVFPKRAGSHLEMFSPALEFVKSAVFVMSLDPMLKNEVASLKKMLLTQVDIRKECTYNYDGGVRYAFPFVFNSSKFGSLARSRRSWIPVYLTFCGMSSATIAPLAGNCS